MNGFILLLVFICGMLFQYIFNLLDLFMQHIQNKQALKTTEIQSKIDAIANSKEELTPAIGFRIEESYEEDEE